MHGQHTREVRFLVHFSIRWNTLLTLVCIQVWRRVGVRLIIKYTKICPSWVLPRLAFSSTYSCSCLDLTLPSLSAFKECVRRVFILCLTPRGNALMGLLHSPHVAIISLSSPSCFPESFFKKCVKWF